MPDDEASIEFPSESMTTSAAVTVVGPNLYRLDTVPIMAESASFGDVIEADRRPDGTLVFQRVAERSTWRTFDFLLSQDVIAGDRIAAVLDKADRLGAHWEQVFGGVLYICVPAGVEWDPTDAIVGGDRKGVT